MYPTQTPVSSAVAAIADSPYTLTILGSLLVSLIVLTQADIINGDGVLYMDVARAFIQGGLRDAFAAFNWPFYGILIGSTHQLTGLNLEHSAHLLNTVLTSIACVAFVAAYKEIHNAPVRPWIGAVLILAHPTINNYREFIIRDFGYWAFLLSGLYFFLRFIRTNSFRDGFAWQLCLFLAIAFRIEAAVFILAPSLYFFFSGSDWRSRTIKVLKSSALFIVAGVCVLAALVAVRTSIQDAVFPTLDRWVSYLSPASIFNGLALHAELLRQQLVHLSSQTDSLIVLISGLTALTIYKIAANSVPIYLATAAIGFTRNWAPSTRGTRATWIFLALALTTVLALVLSQQFLSSRYIVPIVFLLSLFVFAYVDVALQKLASGRSRSGVVIAWIIIGVVFLDGVIAGGASKEAIRTGAEWANQNISGEAPWLCNETRLRFYTENRCHLLDREQLLTRLARPDDSERATLLVWISRKDEHLKKALGNAPHLRQALQIENTKGDALVILEARE